MKLYLMKTLLLAGVAVLSVPTVFAQQEKDKEVEQIIIMRKGDTNEKTVIEINKGQIKINGKDADDVEGVTVDINKLKDIHALIAPGRGGKGSWNFNMDDNEMSLFREDADRPMLGVVTEKVENGAKITNISKESAAEKAGLKEGDIITKIEGEKVESQEDVAEAVRKHKPGEKINLSILRNNKEQKITAELGMWKGIKMNAQNFKMLHPDGAPAFPPNMQFDLRDFNFDRPFDRAPKMGISIQDSENGKGVVIKEVEEESAAAKAGLEKNDIITHVNDKEVNGVEDSKQRS